MICPPHANVQIKTSSASETPINRANSCEHVESELSSETCWGAGADSCFEFDQPMSLGPSTPPASIVLSHINIPNSFNLSLLKFIWKLIVLTYIDSSFWKVALALLDGGWWMVGEDCWSQKLNRSKCSSRIIRMCPAQS